MSTVDYFDKRRQKNSSSSCWTGYYNRLAWAWSTASCTCAAIQLLRWCFSLWPGAWACFGCWSLGDWISNAGYWLSVIKVFIVKEKGKCFNTTSIKILSFKFSAFRFWINRFCHRSIILFKLLLLWPIYYLRSQLCFYTLINIANNLVKGFVVYN